MVGAVDEAQAAEAGKVLGVDAAGIQEGRRGAAGVDGEAGAECRDEGCGQS